MKIIHDPKHGETIDASETMYPTLLTVVHGGASSALLRGDEISTTYGYVIKGSVGMRSVLGLGSLEEGGFFALPSTFEIKPSLDGVVVLIQRFGYRGQPTMGMTEHRGRLTYIDGCSDSMLVYPARQGDPCLNYLHFPPGIDQTQHTHPSIRMGVVARGFGMAHWPGWEEPLEVGSVFLLDEQEMHSFRTTVVTTADKLLAQGRTPGMDVIAFHPDSDWGPTDQNHPMRNRTYIGLDTRGG